MKIYVKIILGIKVKHVINPHLLSKRKIILAVEVETILIIQKLENIIIFITNLVVKPYQITSKKMKKIKR